MPQRLEFVCPLRVGFHARPATRLAEIARASAASSHLINLRSGVRADAKSVLAILAADIALGDACAIEVSGRDEMDAGFAIDAFLRSELHLYEEQAPATNDTSSLPAALMRSGARLWRAVAASSGIGRGRVVAVVATTVDPDEASASGMVNPVDERVAIARAIDAVRMRTRERRAHARSAAEADILDAHVAMVEDSLLRASLDEAISLGQSAIGSILHASEKLGSAVAGAKTAALHDRSADIQGICRQLLDEVRGSGVVPTALRLVEPSIVVAESLTPQELLDLDRQCLAGLVLESAGPTSHAVILARSFGIPTVIGFADARNVLAMGGEAIVDGVRGVVVSELTEEVHEFYGRDLKRRRDREAFLARASAARVSTLDGRSLEVGANAAALEEVAGIQLSGADGIGLFRTELLFSRSRELPSEEAQLVVYGEVVRAMQGRPVIIRTLDIGGDKPLAALRMPQEANPFLGYRGVRVYAEHREVIRGQLRAIVRASAFGPVRVLLPMVSSIEEVLWAKREMAQVTDELAAANIPFDRHLPIGVMVEVPAISFVLDRMCEEVDFFSIGTNDLSQYFFAADRGNARVASLASAIHPGFLRFLKQTVDGIRSRGRWVGLCGEMAGDVRFLPLLVGLGLNEISASCQAIPTLKARVSSLSADRCADTLTRAIECNTSDEVVALLERDRGLDRPCPLVEPEIVRVDCDCVSMEETIGTLVDALYACGRTDDPSALEDAIWSRESKAATVVGAGIAVPHCRSDAVKHDSIGILKLRTPVAWAATSERVALVFLLATRDTNPARAHLQTFSRLARMLMDRTAQEFLLRCDDPVELIARLPFELQAVTPPPSETGSSPAGTR